MTRKRVRTTTTGPRSVCHWTDDDRADHSTINANCSQQQLTLNSFFVAGSRNIKARSIASSPSTPATPILLIPHKIETPQTSSPPSNNDVTTPPSLPKTKQMRQVYLDCGQAIFGQQLCRKCGMLYMPGVTEDMQAHAAICRERSMGVSWRNVNGQRVCFQDKGDSIVCFQQKKNAISTCLEYVYQQVAQDLGMDLAGSHGLVGCTIWLYLRQHRVIGFVSTKPISNAFYLVARKPTEPRRDNNDCNAEDFPLPSNTDRIARRAMLGISILWTHEQFRCQGIATKLVDAARQHAFFGMTVPVQQLAFSSPTQAGWVFGQKYCGTPLLYEYSTKESKS